VQRESHRKLFNKFHILPLANEYLLTAITFITDNLEVFQTQGLMLSIQDIQMIRHHTLT